MSISKNFVIKHGLEVSTDLILANADTRRVGIASTNPQYTLDVSGGIGATDFYLTGIGTFANELNVGLGGTVLTVLGIGNSIGIGTALPQYLLDIRSPVSTGQTALYVQGDVRITGDLNIDDINLDDATIQDLNVTGITTVGFITATNLYVAGVGTFLSSGLKIRNVANTFQYSITGGAITANRTLNIPVITGTDTLATLGLTQTFSGATNTFSGTLSASSTLTLSGSATGTHVFGSSQTSGTLTFGGTSGTGLITVGQGTTTQTTNIQAGVTVSGQQKTINLGTGGASGSRTLITVGSATAGAISTVAINPGTNLILGLTAATPTGTTLQPLQVGSASSVQGAYISGSVGIGVTNPGATLNVVPTSPSIAGLFSGTTSSDMVRITQLGTGNALVVEDSANPDATSFVVNAAGDVGIGTTNPEKPLHLSTSVATPLIIQRTSTNNSAAEYRNTTSSMFAGLISNATGWGVGATADLASDAQILITRTGGELLVGSLSTTGTTSQKLQVTGGAYISGNVGIGTTNPTSKLSVVGDGNFTGDIIGSASSINRLYVTGISTFVGFSTFNDSVVVEDNLRVGGISTFVGFSTFNDSVVVEDNLRVGGISTFKNDVEFSGPSGITSVYWDNSENALKFLDNAYAFFGFDDDLKIYHDGSNSWIRDSGFGDLLIAGSLIKITNSNNTSSSIIADPAGKVELYYNNDKKIETVSTGATVYGTFFTNGSVLVGRATTTGTANQALQVESGAYFNGSVGIGTDNPGAKLDVSGDIRLSSADPEIEFNNGGPRLKVPAANTLTIHTGGGLNTTGNEVVRINNTGVGIGTTNPTEKLDVNGNVKLTGSIYGPSELIIDPAAVGNNTGSVRIKGDLYVDGTQTILNSTTIELADFNVGIATTVGTNALLDGAGIGIGSTGIRKTLTYANTPSDSLKSSENFDLASGKVYKIDGTSVLSSTTLESSIVNSSLTSVGTLTKLIVTGVTTSGGYNATTGNEYKINGTSVLTSTTLGSNVVNSSLTSVGTLGQLNVSGVSTFAGITTVTGTTLFSKQLNVSGVSTLGVTTATNVILQQLNVSGVSTLGVTTATNLTLQQLNVSGVSTLGVTTATNLTLQQLNVSGVSTFAGITTVTGTTLFSKQLNVSGVSTLGGNVSVAGSIFPSTDATYDLGSLSLRWRNVYTTDLQLSNEGSQNEVDNTWGKWTIQEGEENLFIINRRTGKKYKFLLEEVN